ncbi:carboxylating nicotinate-nucleotide diphosphorylase [Kerstersia sp.]|uniref:carboxylating nicotinate-nucleotide diphosphorylase n=1 Tax=Kerstersia sp. TaxID=1930783 RepID=UPI003F8F0B66
MLEPQVRAALLEDLGRRGDVTSDTIIPADTQATLALRAREAGVLAGLDAARLSFELMDSAARLETFMPDGSRLAPGDTIAHIHGPARALLSAERTALNYLSHLSGIASATARIADAIRPYGTRVNCTRKTLPGLRSLQKYAVRVGGGSNHRYGLDDAVLIKDNHIALCGSLRTAVERARAHAGHLTALEVEVDTLAQLREALDLNVAVVLLDNMDTDTLRAAVALARGRAITEASGGVSETSAASIAATGVDYIAIGALTHSVRALDIGLDSLSP